VANSNSRQAFVASVAARHGRRLLDYLSRRLRNASDAPDIAQEVYLRLLRLDEHDLIRNPEAYLLTVARHLLYEHTLRQNNAPPHIEFEDLGAEPSAFAEDDPAGNADAQQRVQSLEKALMKLSPKAQAALVLHRRDGLSIEEVGERIGVSRNVAKKYLARALLHCRKHLK
jgi:RNA polymerase sigma factor (sigma-70 family)